MFVALEGSIASGKSSTARRISEILGWQLALEQTSRHPFLDEFYAAPSQVALETELVFILLHYHQLRPLTRVSDLITDFSPVKDLIFGHLNLVGEDRDLFDLVYEKLITRVAIPDLVIFLDMPPEELKKRSLARGRPFEANLSLDYLRRLREAYEPNLERLGREVHILPVSPDQTQEEVVQATLQLISGASGQGTRDEKSNLQPGELQ